MRIDPYARVGKSFLYLHLGGGNSYDYRPQISDALAGANLPKSPLAQQTNSLLQNTSGSIFSQLLNAQNLGNAFSGNMGNGSNNTFSFPVNGSGGAGSGTVGQSQQPQQPQNNSPQIINSASTNPQPQTQQVQQPQAQIQPTQQVPSYNDWLDQINPDAANSMSRQDLLDNYTSQFGLPNNAPQANNQSNPLVQSQQGTAQNVSGQHWSMSDPRTQAQILQEDYGGNYQAFLAASPNQSVSALANNPAYQQALQNGYSIGQDGSLIDSSGRTVQGPNSTLAGLNNNVQNNATTNTPIGSGGVYGVGGNGQPIPGSGSDYLVNGQHYSDLNSATMAMLSGFQQGQQGQNVQGSGIPGFNSANPQLSQLGFQNQNSQALQTLSQLLGGPQLSNYNPASQLLGQGQFQNQIGQANIQGISGLSDAIQRAFSQGVSQVNAPNLQGGASNALQTANPQNVTAPNAQLNLPQNQDVSQTAMDSPYYNAVQQILQQKQTNDVNDLRSRFTAGGTSRGTPAAFAEASLRAQQAPEITAALGGVRQQEIANALQGQQNNISGAQVGNNSLLSARGQDIGNSQQNVQNLLQAAGLNNSANLQNQGLQNDFSLGSGAQSLQAQQMNQNAGGGLLSTLLNQYNNQNQNTLQNYYSSVGANQQQGGLLNQLLGQAGSQNLGLQQLGSQNYFNAAGQNSQNANNVLGNQNNYLSTILGAQNQNNSLLSQLGQFNAGQANQYGLQLQGQQQAANENQIGRQFTGLQNLLSGILGLAGAGTPGGSANVNLNAAPVGGYNSTANSLGALSSLIGSFS